MCNLELALTARQKVNALPLSRPLAGRHALTVEQFQVDGPVRAGPDTRPPLRASQAASGSHT
eukprot:3941570-Rhodomonas_salina.2